MSRRVSKQKHCRCPKGKLTSVCWHFEGKQFVCSLSDGSLVTYNLRGGQGKWAKQVKWIFLIGPTRISSNLQPADNCNQTRCGLTRARTPRGSHCPRLTRCISSAFSCVRCARFWFPIYPKSIHLMVEQKKGAHRQCSQVEWVVGRDGEHIFIFSGGLPQVRPVSSLYPKLALDSPLFLYKCKTSL